MADLIAFFSRNGQNYVRGMVQDLAVGNTEVVAGIIQRLTGAELFKSVLLRLRRTSSEMPGQN